MSHLVAPDRTALRLWYQTERFSARVTRRFSARGTRPNGYPPVVPDGTVLQMEETTEPPRSEALDQGIRYVAVVRMAGSCLTFSLVRIR